MSPALALGLAVSQVMLSIALVLHLIWHKSAGE